jgi:hypothetical protein
MIFEILHRRRRQLQFLVDVTNATTHPCDAAPGVEGALLVHLHPRNEQLNAWTGLRRSFEG